MPTPTEYTNEAQEYSPRILSGFTPAQAPRGTPSFWDVFPTQAAAEAFLAHLCAHRMFNYYVGWRDVNGWCLEAGWATWVGEGHVYMNLWDDSPRLVKP